MNNINVEKIDKNRFRVTLKVPLEGKWYDNVMFNCFNSKDYYRFSIPHKDNQDNIITFEGEVELPDSALYNTFISCSIDGVEHYLDKDMNFGRDISLVNMKKMSVNFNVPEWAKGTMIYHIFVDRFNRSDESKLVDMPRRNIHRDLSEEPQLGPDSEGIWNNDFYGGDLQGITDKLEYIRKMGFKVLFLSPIVQSQSNHRYDSGDYENVDPLAGTVRDLRNLCDKAHSLGMKVILDGVFNHTGNDSKYFNEYGSYDSVGAYQDPNSEYSKFYRKSRDEHGRDVFQYWWGFKNLPECDCNSPAWQQFICGKKGVIDIWFRCGIDGLRLDVADELSDHFIELIREACERNKPDSFVYGEVWEQLIYKNRDYVMSGHAMHSVMNYKGMDALLRYYMYGDVDKLRGVFEEIVGEYPKETRDSLMNSTSTHDISRIITILGAPYLFDPNSMWAWDFDNNRHDFIRQFKLNEEEYRTGRDKYLSYLLALGFLPGNLTVFYGDEAGLQGLGNLQNRRYFPWGNIDPVIHGVVTDIGKIKEDNSFLSSAEPRIVDITNDYIMYERYCGDNKLLVCTNRSNREVDILLPGDYKQKVYSLKRSSGRTLNPYGGIVMKNRDDDEER